MPAVPSKSSATIAPPGMLLKVPVLLPLVVVAQPGVRNASPNALRPITGRLNTCLVSMLVESELASVCTMDSAAFTVTVSLVVPILRVARTFVSRLVRITTDSKTCAAKPAALTFSSYAPPGRLGNEYTPFAWVAPRRTSLVERSLNSRLTLGTLAPEGSSTLTLRLPPVDVVWPQAPIRQHRIVRLIRKTLLIDGLADIGMVTPFLAAPPRRNSR